MESKMLRVVEAAMRLICITSMSSRSSSREVERVVQVEKNEIDYDLLANAIVKAHKSISDAECVTQNERIKKASVSATLFSSMASIFLWMWGIVLIVVSIVIWTTKYKYLCEIDWGMGFWTIRVWIDVFIRFDIGAIIMILLGVLSFASGNEIGNEQDKNYIVAVFSAVTSMAALMVALVALSKMR